VAAGIAASAATAPRADRPSIGILLWLGFRHIVPEGLDHILFVVGLWLGTRTWRSLLVQVTTFTAAHSLTLGLVMAGVIPHGGVIGRVVEIGIAVSIAWIAIENCRADGVGRRRWLLVAAFGLLHGMGFAGALSEQPWPADGLAIAVALVNVGIEGGQLAVLAACAALVGWAWRRPWYRTRIAIPASLAIGLCGLFWAVQRSLAWGS
jgi:hypothetical protein